MNSKNIFLLLLFHSLIIPFSIVNAQTLRINEVLASNTIFLDEDQQSSDWIELYNPTNQEINLEGYFISDRFSKPTKWKFPKTTINPDDYLVVWASKKDRNLHIIFRALSNHGDEFRYKIPTQELDPEWNQLNFDDSNWEIGESGFGYGDDDDNTIIPENTGSIYLRRSFNIENIDQLTAIFLHMDYDDAFVAYINGVEIARANIEGTPPAFDQFSIEDHEALLYNNGFPEGYFLNNLSDFIVEGQNVLAIQGHNSSESSSDFSIIPFLTGSFNSENNNGTESEPILNFKDNHLHTNFKLSSDGESLYLFNQDTILVDSMQIPPLNTDISFGVNQTTNELNYFQTPTPNFANSSTSYSGQSNAQIQFSHSSGVYDSILLSLTVDGNKTIKYTLDASIPTDTSETFSGPISINTNTIVRARVFEENLIPSLVQTKSYLINTSHQIPIISLVTENHNLYDYEEGIYSYGPEDYQEFFPFMGANFWEDWEKPIYLSYHENQTLSFEMDAGVKIYGGWSRAFDQKSFAIYARKKYGHGEIAYPLFPNRPYNEYQNLVLRNSGSDWLNSNIRDGVLTTLMEGSGIELMAYRPVASYLNGEYWGIYNMREKINEHMLAAKFNIEPDSIKILEYDGEGEEEYRAFISYVNLNDLAEEDHYTYVASQMDIDNYIKYQLVEIFINNTDWPGNNVKFWKSPTTKWRWLLFDTDFGFGIWNPQDFYFNTLEFALEPSAEGWPNPPWSTLLFRKLIENINFRNKFVNQYADELNTRFLPSNIHNHIDSISNLSLAEIPQHYDRWGGDQNVYETAIENMKNFASQRPDQCKNHILTSLSLPAFHQITTQIDDTEKGFIQLNSLTLTEEEWQGDYFQEVPINIAAIAKDGYIFSHWSGGINSTDSLLTINMLDSLTLKANFKISSSTNETTVSPEAKIFPNPSSSELNLQLKQFIGKETQILLYSLDGKMIKELYNERIKNNNQTISFNLNNLAEGSYVIHIITNKNQRITLDWIKLDSK